MRWRELAAVIRDREKLHAVGVDHKIPALDGVGAMRAAVTRTRARANTTADGAFSSKSAIRMSSQRIQ